MDSNLGGLEPSEGVCQYRALVTCWTGGHMSLGMHNMLFKISVPLKGVH